MRHPYTLLLSPLLLVACATPANHYDPLEPVNRKVYAFNSALDKAVLKPVAQGYVAITPKPVRAGVSNFFGNLEDIYIGASNLLQGKWREAVSDGGRVVFNSTLGLFGLIDIATPAGLPKHDEDFGQVLGAWGVPSGPYIVMPFLGPKTLRDSSDWVGSYALNPMRALHDDDTSLGLNLLKLVDTRATLLPADALIESASFGDEYGFVRDSYLQRRYNLVWDGAPAQPLPLGEVEADETEPAPANPAAPAAPQQQPVETVSEPVPAPVPQPAAMAEPLDAEPAAAEPEAAPLLPAP
ncbi:hypothetical protein GCM10007907_06830 [Chitinimonas prasina]|uniref:VacJ family lipoprotein n=1 Tax=Chitinimonas prasina TaxID=1434937 RepID=A0ABQ5YBP3_9NEIS|nr:VacJ family lipoprotein [Chitinimonas prasina]GLR11893.1 hypothetical protein GCM10007907_06830 [Chitinimonas prasina]